MAASNPDSNSPPIDRQTTTPFHLKLFYRQNSFHHLSDYPIPSGSGAPAAPHLPPHLQIYTWYSCSLRELAHLLTSCLPALLPDPPIGTRLSFRLVYPDTKSHAGGFGAPPGAGAGHDEGQGRYLSKDMGSVIVGPKDDHDGKDASAAASSSTKNIRLQGEEAERTLQDVRFIIGDYVECAILPPLADGSVAPPISSRGVLGGPGLGGGMRAFPPVRENGFGRHRHGGGGPGGFPGGDWRRGERVPDGGRVYSRDNARRGDRGLDGGRAYGRDNHRSRGRPY